MLELSQEQIKYENLKINAQLGEWKNYPFMSLGNALHWIYVYTKSSDIASTIQVGQNEVTYRGKPMASIIWDDKLRMPLFTFTSEYEWIAQAQKDYFYGLINFEPVKLN